MNEAPAPRFPRARITDTSSSHAAAAELEASGADERQRAAILSALRTYTNATSRELAHHAGLDRYAVVRRLPELAEDGLVLRVEITEHTTPCEISARRALRWRLA